MRYRNLLLFLVLAAVWGSAFVAIKAGLDLGFPPVLFAAVRYDVAGVLMLAYAAFVTDRPLPRGRAEWATVAVGATFLIAGYHSLLFVGEGFPEVTSAAAAVVVSLSPVLTTAFARVLLPDERLGVVGLVGMVLGLVGVAVIDPPDPTNLLGNLGLLLVFGAALAFAFGSVLTRRIDADLPIETMEAWSMVGGALLMHGLSAGLGESPAAMLAAVEAAPVDAIGSLAYLSLAASALGFLVYFDLLDRLGPVEINLVSYVAPVFAALVGFLLLSEVIDANTVAGFLVIVVGFVLVKREAIRAEWRRYARSTAESAD
ncbi:DMT family transporter [Salinirubellus salinus]|uniref:DMT family transporter n=1 Tax=Salinirubellus salinus TaxID=1364945 RepID=A0A9E7R163_9EURY|nr:DMT family transporter [Salinirubellus salinus]UWM53003.1 DMT family transporter [Salinirubellus salinus]